MTRSLRDLVGQSLMLSFEGQTATPDVLDALSAARPCGVILFARNIGTPRQLHALTGALQAHARSIGLAPLLIAIDQEGGTVTRLPVPFTTVPSQMAQAATGDSSVARECARISGQQLRAFGINTNFAPSLDVNCNPHNPIIGIRSFGEDPAVVTEYGLQALRGYDESGVIATVKHFPGHGDTDVDSHLGLPIVRHDLARLSEIELAPFKAAIAAGVPALMTAHIIFETLDSHPATLSSTVLGGLLRDEMGFDGLVFTDALEMQAIAATYGPNEAALRSKHAGADVLLPCGVLADQVAIVDALAQAIDDGRLPRSVFERSAERLDRVRERYDLSYDLPPFAPPEPALRVAALAIARRSIAVAHGADRLPLPTEQSLLLIDCVLPRFSLAEEALERADLLRGIVRAQFPNGQQLTLGPQPTDEDLLLATGLARVCDAVLLVTRNASLIEQQASFARALAQLGRPIYHAVVRGPYDAGLLPQAAATLLTFGDPDVSLQALVDVLSGRAEPVGTLPVTLPELV